jgi:hypothetical protein
LGIEHRVAAGVRSDSPRAGARPDGARSSAPRRPRSKGPRAGSAAGGGAPAAGRTRSYGRQRGR